MSAFDNINDALNSYNDSIKDQPLLSDDDITKLIRQEPLPLPNHRKPSFGFGPYLAVGLAAAAVVAVVLWPDANPIVQPEPLTPADAYQDNVIRSSEPSLADAQQNRVADVPDAQSIPSVRSIQLTESELSQLGLKLMLGKMIYIDPGIRITIGTNGISAKHSNGEPTKYSPRHISMYHQGKLFASWFDADDDVNVNDLVAVQVHLDDANSTLFPSADVILWYVPTPEFKGRVPDPESVRTNETTPTISNGEIASSMIFPNPVNGNSATLRVELQKEIFTSAVLVDVSGRHIRDLWTSMNMLKGAHDQPIADLGSLPNGMYLVVVFVDGSQERVIQRLLIER